MSDKEQRGRFIADGTYIPCKIIDIQNLNPDAFLIFAWTLRRKQKNPRRYSSKFPYGFPMTYISKGTGLSMYRVRNAIKYGEENKFLRVTNVGDFRYVAPVSSY